MERRVRITMASVLLTLAVIFTTGCTTEKQKEAAKETQQQTEQTPEDKKTKVSEDDAKEMQKENRYRPLMEAVIEAIESDDAGKLYELQESADVKELALSVRDGEHFIYFPEEDDNSKGIGFYTFKECSCKQWYYGDYKDGEREGKGIWYYVSRTEDGSLYKEVYNGSWSEDAPNGKGRQLIAFGDSVDTDKKFKVKNGLFYGTYKIKEKLDDGTIVRGKYKLKKGKYVTIPDEALVENKFAVPDEPHLAIAFLYDGNGIARSCRMVYAEDITKGVKHFYQSE